MGTPFHSIRRTLLYQGGGLLLVMPFVLLTINYAVLPAEITITRGWDGRASLQAPKSLVTVFRVPIIGALTAFAAAWMAYSDRSVASATDRRAVELFWLILFVTACCKSTCEGVELAEGLVPEWSRAWAGRAVVVVVVAGLIAAAVQLQWAWPAFQHPEYWRASHADRVVFPALIAAYVGFALVPILFASRPHG